MGDNPTLNSSKAMQIRTSNPGVIEFYRRIGYATDDVVSMGKRLQHDHRAT